MTTMQEPVAVLLDTDIGYDIDDEWALAVCLAHPRINLLGVTTVHGDTVARAVLATVVSGSSGRNGGSGRRRRRHVDPLREASSSKPHGDYPNRGPSAAEAGAG